MTGIEALSLLKDGKLLRRTSWEEHEKCKAVDFFGQWVIHIAKEEPEEISDEELKEIFDERFQLVETPFDDFFGLFDTIDAGEFLHDDWETVEWDTEEDLVRPPTQFAKEIIEDYKQAVQNGKIIRGEDL